MDETQVQVASQEQPTDELAVTVPAVESDESATSTEPVNAATSTETEPPEPLILGKYKTNEDVYQALQHSNAEASRMAAELAGYRNGVKDAGRAPQAPPASTTPKYTVEQLEYAKVDLLTNLAAAQASGETTKARELAGNIAWCDREIRTQEYSTFTQRQTAQTAQSQIMQDALTVVRKYQADIEAGPGNALYDKAAALHGTYLAMGQPDNDLTRAQAIAFAANLLGKDAAGVEQASRKQLTSTLQKSLKAAVTAGSGKGDTKGSASPDFGSMTDTQFTAWQKQRGLA